MTDQREQGFARQLAQYKQRIDDDIAAYSQHARTSTATQYGEHPTNVTEVFLDVLSRGGKRLRGALVCLGYEMSGGTDMVMITRAATAIEMIHAYILIIDDIQDRSPLRRGKPSAHAMLETYHHEKHLRGDAHHAGMALALDAALSGMHAAQMLLANLSANPELRLKVVSIVNRTMLVTAHGQTQDMMNEMLPEASAADIERVLEWKTANYSVLNPLHVGMVLADADCHATDAITPYALHVGKAFQITDDILGIFGDEKASGKNSMDDIREGKQTILTAYALAHAPAADVSFLRSMLGNNQLEVSDFIRCKEIITASGALDHARQLAEGHVQQAVTSLDTVAGMWSKEGVAFLRELALYLPQRSA